MRRTAALLVAVLGLAAVGCEGDDEQSSAPQKVTTTRVQVVEGLGREGGFDPSQIYNRLAPGVVTILSVFDAGASILDEGGEGGQGSGFVLDGEGYIATNAHVVTGDDGGRAEDMFIEFSDGNRVRAEIVGVDPNVDVALLKVDPEGLELTPLRLGVSHRIVVGEPVAAIGSPFGERQSLSIGVISAIDRNIESLTRFQIGDAIQTDAAINPGNSGGPLLDAQGRVLGINAQIKSQSGGGEGVGFAIPVDAVRRSLRELRGDGRVSYGYLGVQTLVLWPQLADRLELDVRDGALIQEIEDGSPADKADLRPGDDEIGFQATPVRTGGDVIVAVDGHPLSRRDDLADEISAMSAGDEVRLEVVRDGKHQTIRVRLGQRPPGSG
ncbi:MAG: trypsin-like peptidase domain-containing protein [Thermoleophilaceae bacterium]|nr:trypsin-like peptidase domain-containing protein [Thermoleophilaceae bacterium]